MKVIGTNSIRKIDILRNNELLCSYCGDNQLEEIEYLDTEEPATISLYPLLFYYVRVIQVDREMAWSSPYLDRVILSTE